MAATQGLPAHFFYDLKQSMSSTEDMLCFLEQLDPSLPFKCPESILRDLHTQDTAIQHCLELVLSYGLWAQPLGQWLERTFPVPLPTPSTECLHTTILLRLVNYIYFFGVPLEGRHGQGVLQDDRNFALRASDAIAKLDAMTFDVETEGKVDDALLRGNTYPRKKPSQAERKRQLQAGFRREKQTKSEAEAEIFRALDLPVPENSEAAKEMASQLSLQLKQLLVKYITVIREEKISQVIVSSFPPKLDAAADAAVKIKHRPDPIVISSQPADIVSPVAASAFDQPLKAALYFDSAADFGDWEIFVSSKAIGDIRAAQRRDRSFYDIIMKKIKELSHSHFSDDNQKALIGGNNAVPVYEAKMTSDSRLVYQIDCLPDFSGERERQVIRIFGVYTHTQLNRVWESLGYQLARLGGKEHVSRCRQRVYNRERNLVIPAVFPPNKRTHEEPVYVPELPKDDLEEIHAILVLEKFVNFSKELRNSLIAELDVQHVFNLSPQEMSIIEHPHSCYVLGRSGTGKTTTMLFKMLGLERTFLSLVDPGMSKPRQLFVTQSAVLAARVEDYFVKLLASLRVGQKTESELAELAAERSRFRAPTAPKSMVHKKDMRWKAELPSKFSLLQDEHFPLFLTFERLIELIIADALASDDDSWLQARLSSLNEREADKFASLVHLLSTSKNVLRYPTFLAEYWNHFPQGLTKGLDPALVFSEILGVIKGAEKSVTSKGRYLDKETYLSLSKRTNYLFSSQRERIYDIFVKYARRKRELKGYDAADRTHAILEFFDLVGVPGSRVDFLYVDEAQDNMLIDAMLLRSVCKNPLGLFWAGDTAQTIAIGNSFRFEDLKAFLHRLEERRAQQLLDAVRNDYQRPTSFALATNYRSHGGIIACAHSIVEIITRFWPTSLDKMAPEKGIIGGMRPLFLGGTNVGDLRFHDFMKGGESNIEFGAAQCILVRDEAARSKLLKEVGDIGIVMTLYDSKGLEFDDVLLYQFFEDSTVDLRRWRVLLNMVPGHVAPTFDDTRHAGLCSELKFLYVAVTRARKKLWIYDSSDKALPLQTVWSSFDLVENFESDGSQLPQFASASSRQEWQETAERLFDNENYYESVGAFKRAGSTRQADVAQAYLLRKEAELSLLKPARRKLYQSAARAFLQCADAAPDDHDRKAFRSIAGLCFTQAEEYAQAADAYRAAEEFGSALQMYRKVGMFDEGVQIVKNHNHEIDDKASVNDFKDVAKVFYLKDKEISKAQELFDSSEEVLTYLEDNAFLDESRALLLEEMGEPILAADVHLAEGRLLEAIRVLTSDNGDPEAVTRGHDIIIQGLWKAMPFGNLKNYDEAESREMIQLAFTITQGPLQEQAAMFIAIDQADWVKTRAFGRQFLFEERTHMFALLCFSYALHPSNLPEIKRWTNTELAELLSDFLGFCSLLRYHADNLDLRNEALQRLFKFRSADVQNTYLVPPGSWLHAILNAPGNTETGSSSGDISIASQTLGTTLRNGILGFIASVLDHENRTALAFTPCVRYVLEDHCRFGDECFNHHIPLSDLTHQWLATQVRIHFQQVILCQMKESIPADLGGGYGSRRFWINRIFQTLNPPAGVLGSWSSVNPAQIPESKKAFGIMRSWCHDLLYGRTGKREEQELSTIYQAADLCFHLDRPNATRYVHASTLVKRLRHVPVFYRASGGIFTIPELLGSLDASHPWFLNAGLLFARHVLDVKLFIDLNILCTFMEYLTSAFILAYHNFRWHNITLPRKHFIQLFYRLRRGIRPDVRYYAAHLLDVWNRLLCTLVTGEGAYHLAVGTKNAVPVSIRRSFIPRVCRAMCLVGYNIQHEPLQMTIMEKLKPLESSEYHTLYLSYALARSWQDAKRALWSNQRKTSPLDDLVQLWSANVREPIAAAPGSISRVVFNKVDDIPGLLTRPIPSLPVPELPCLPRSEMPTSQPTAPEIHDSGGKLLANAEGKGEDSNRDHGDVASAALEDSSESFGALEAMPTVNMVSGPTDEEIGPELMSAGIVLCEAYRSLLKRRERENARSRREIAYQSFYRVCLEHTGNIHWPDTDGASSYRKLYLGVLPHLLVVIQWIQSYVSLEKPAAKEALKAAAGVNFERGMARIVRINVIAKTLDKLHKTIEPEAPFHLRRDARELRKIILEVEELFRRLPKAMASEVGFDLYMAKPPEKVHEKLRRPPLNWDDDGGRFEYDD